MKSKFTKAILISILVSVGIIALLSVALLFWLFPSGIVTRASLYSFLISFIPVIAAGIVLAISLLWIESANYSLNKVAADYDPDAINPSGYDSPLYNSVNEEKDYDSAFLKGAPIPEDWERIEEYDPLDEKQKNRISAKTAKYEKDGEQTFADAYPDFFKEDEGENVFAFIPPEENKELQPFGAYEFDLPEVKKPELSAAKGSVNFIWNKDTAQRFDGELYISPSPEQIMRGEFVKKLRPTVYVEPDVIMTGAYNLNPEECTEFESEAVVYSYEDNSLSEQYAAMKHSEEVESPVFKDEQKTEELGCVDVYNGDLFVAPIELSPSSKSANASYAYLTHPYENKEPITRAEGCVDFTWNKDTAKRFEGELYISPSPDQIERGEFVKKLRPTTAAAVVMSGEYNLNPEEITENESEAVVYSYEEDHSLSEQYATMKHSEEVESPVFEDETTAEAKAQSEVQKCKYCPNGQAIDGADHDSAYSTLMLTSASKNITEEAYQRLWLIEDVVINQTEEDAEASAKEEESDVYSGDLFVTPIELSPSSESANESYSYLTHPYGNPEYADYSARKLPPFTEFDFDLPKKKEPITRAEGCVDFAWNKDTAVRGEGERYIEPTEEMKKRGEFVAHLSPVKAPEKIDTAGPAYEALALPQNVSEGFEEESTAEAKEQSEVQKCKYCPNGQAIDGADHDSAYSALMLTSASKNITEEAYQRLWLIEDVVINQTEEDVQTSAKEEESNVYSGDLFVTPIEMSPSSESANESYSYLTHPYGNPAYADYSARKLPPFTEFEFDLPKKKEPITRAEGCVDFTWNKDTAVRGEGERYIEPTEEMKKRGEFVAHLSPVKAPEKIDTVSPAYEALSLPQNVSEGFEEESTAEAKEQSEVQKCKYCPNGQAIDGADHDSAYSTLMLTSASKNITEEAYQRLWLIEDVVINQTEEDVAISAKEEESNAYAGDLFVSPTEMSPSSESANESYSYLTHPYGNPAYADYASRKLPPFTEFEFDLPKKKEPITRAEGCVDFAWNKDTAVRGEGERYIEPTEEMKERGEFVAHLSPVKAPEKIDTVGPAYEELSLPQNVSEGEEDKENSAALDTDVTENIVKYVADSAVDANADTNDAYYALMGMTGKTKPAEPISFSQEFTSILQLEMNSALSLGYELTIARITSNYVDSIMALDFEALAFKESDDRACIIFQCQTKAEAGELVSMIKEAIGDKSLKVKMAELKGRNITPDAFSKEIMK